MIDAWGPWRKIARCFIGSTAAASNRPFGLLLNLIRNDGVRSGEQRHLIVELKMDHARPDAIDGLLQLSLPIPAARAIACHVDPHVDGPSRRRAQLTVRERDDGGGPHDASGQVSNSMS